MSDNEEITLDEISIIKNKYESIVTRMVVLNQKHYDTVNKFEELYKDIEVLRNDLQILKDRKLKENGWLDV